MTHEFCYISVVLLIITVFCLDVSLLCLKLHGIDIIYINIKLHMKKIAHWFLVSRQCLVCWCQERSVFIHRWSANRYQTSCNTCTDTSLQMIGYFSAHIVALGHFSVLRTAIFKLLPRFLVFPWIPEFVLAEIWLIALIQSCLNNGCYTN